MQKEKIGNIIKIGISHIPIVLMKFCHWGHFMRKPSFLQMQKSKSDQLSLTALCQADLSAFVFHYLDNMSFVVRKPVFGVSTRSDTNRAIQPQKMARGLKFRI